MEPDVFFSSGLLKSLVSINETKKEIRGKPKQIIMDNAVVCFFRDSQFFNGNIRSISDLHISDTCQTSKMGFFAKIVNDFLQNVKRYILDV